MQNVSTRAPWFAATMTALFLASPALAADNKDEIERVSRSIEVLQQLMSAPDDAIPEHILERAEAIVVIPTLVKGGFVLGAEHGKGVMSIRNRGRGTWSVPSFVAVTGGTVGWQIGVHAVDLVLLVMNTDGIDDLLSSKFTLGANGSVAAGPVGRAAHAATDATMGAKILAYSRARGLFAGATLEGSSLRHDTDANRRVYGGEYSAREVFAMTPPAALPRVLDTWRDTLRGLASTTHD